MPDESYYQERGEGKSWPKLVLIILGIIIFVIIIFLLLKGCGNNKVDGNLEQELLKAGKQYYDIDETLLPQATGECKRVTLGELLNEELIVTKDTFKTCNQDKTYVKVCKLESGSYHYLPVMQCGENLADDNFGPWKDGSEDDLVTDKSDVKFSFLGETLEVSDDTLDVEKEAWIDELNGINYKTIKSTNYYRYRDLAWKWQTTSKKYYDDNYYKSAPSSEYSKADPTVSGYKWYTEKTKTVDSTDRKMAKIFQYGCTNASGSVIVKSNIECSKRTDAATITVVKTYTCNGTSALQTGESEVCAASCPRGTLSADKKQCTYNEKYYYPSNNTDAAKENHYYTVAPTNGAKKDESTLAQVAKYYKDIVTVTDKYYATAPSPGAVRTNSSVWGNWSSYQVEQPKAYSNTRQIESRKKVVYRTIMPGTKIDNWKQITDGFVTEDELITTFKSLGNDVNSLSDIEMANDLRYQVKLQYRDRK